MGGAAENPRHVCNERDTFIVGVHIGGPSFGAGDGLGAGRGNESTTGQEGHEYTYTWLIHD